jgi:anti-sigma B factor antagonist
MDYSKKTDGNVTILTLSGKIVGGPESLKFNQTLSNLIEEGSVNVILDLSKIELMNSSGLGIIIHSVNQLKQNSGSLKLANVSSKIRQIMEITKLDSIFQCYDTVEDAVKSFK